MARLFPVAPSGGAQAARTPFVLLVVLLLGGGLITLLLLNSSLNEGSFKLSRLKKQTTELTDDEQQLQRDVDSYSAPDALQRRARELGMVQGGDPVFLTPNGTVRGVPSPAALTAPAYQAPPPPEMIHAAPSASESAATTPTTTPPTPATPGATPSAGPSTGPSAGAPAGPSAHPSAQPDPNTSATPTAPAPSNPGR
ncbi:septum formation initiator family protein [Streptomyces kunmingensis]|uniref:Septum formation initiator family protein n=1 Tax=Streptomyces kunmingensis TaxID=68225 RepID=A0ABU6C8V0_9ACTN|nr:septum formation initiator family protein [Streptomyces kunmingensis]MEB3961139.1 septum formation initiator family protein [Streptomyces kunmingensis]